MDAARTALRLGASDVKILYRRSREPRCPRARQEQEEAHAEGVKFEFLTAPTAFEVEGRQGLRRQVRPDGSWASRMRSGRRQAGTSEGKRFHRRGRYGHRRRFRKKSYADGRRPGRRRPRLQHGLEDTVAYDPVTLATPMDRVFAGGDAASGPATVIEAVAAGNRAARSIANLSRGQAALRRPAAGRDASRCRRSPTRLSKRPSAAHALEVRPLQPMPEAPVTERVRDFREVALGYDDATAIAEARAASPAASAATAASARRLPGQGDRLQRRRARRDRRRRRDHPRARLRAI